MVTASREYRDVLKGGKGYVCTHPGIITGILRQGGSGICVCTHPGIVTITADPLTAALTCYSVTGYPHLYVHCSNSESECVENQAFEGRNTSNDYAYLYTQFLALPRVRSIPGRVPLVLSSNDCIHCTVRQSRKGWMHWAESVTELAVCCCSTS